MSALRVCYYKWRYINALPFLFPFYSIVDPAFPVVAARKWNSLHQHVTSVSSQKVFRACLKTYLFSLSFQ